MSKLKNICDGVCNTAKYIKNDIKEQVMSIDPDEHRNVTDDTSFFGDRFTTDWACTCWGVTIGGTIVTAAAQTFGLVDAETANELIRNGSWGMVGMILPGLGARIACRAANNAKINRNRQDLMKHENSQENTCNEL